MILIESIIKHIVNKDPGWDFIYDPKQTPFEHMKLRYIVKDIDGNIRLPIQKSYIDDKAPFYEEIIGLIEISDEEIFKIWAGR